MRILVVEDDGALRAVLVELLQANGYAVRGACDGADAFDAMAVERPDIILLDMDMPRMNGREFLAQQRQNRRDADVPVLVMSASARPDNPRLPFIEKPFDSARLLEALVTVAAAARPRPMRSRTAVAAGLGRASGSK